MNVVAATSVEGVEWGAATPAERDAASRLEIDAAQVEFAGTMARSLGAREAGDPAHVAGLILRVGADVVGWVLLKRGPAAPDWADAGAVVVGGLRIDRRHQGRGLGSLALAEMARWVGRHWPGATRLMLRVDDANAAAIGAYGKAGWVEVGERRVGRVGIERTMARRL